MKTPLITLGAALLVSGSAVLGNESGMNKKQYQAKYAPCDLKIDGDLSDWKKLDPVPLILADPADINIGGWQGFDDSSAVCYLMWNEKYLYLAAEVKDDKHSPAEAGAKQWHGDSFQLGFDVLSDALQEPGYSDDDIEMGIAETTSGPQTWIMQGGRSGKKGLIDPKFIPLAVKRDDKRKITVYEVALPWTLFTPLKPQSGGYIGFNIVLNENDGTKRRGYIHWTPGIADAKAPWQFGRINFAPKNEKVASAPQVYGNQTYFKPGELAGISCYIPVSSAMNGKKMPVAINVYDGTKKLFSAKKSVKAESGVTRVDFETKFPSVEGRPLRCELVSGNAKSETLINVLSVAELKKAATALSAKSARLREKIEAAKKTGLAMDYPQVAVAMADVFILNRLKDMKNTKALSEARPLIMIRNQFKYIDTSLDAANREVDYLVKHPDKIRKVPYVKMQGIKVADGAFRKDGQPLMLLGPSGWWSKWLLTDLGYISQMGYNFTAAGLAPDWVLGRSQKTIDTCIARCRRLMLKAAECNMAVDWLVSPHPVPKRWAKQHPDFSTKKNADNGFLRLSKYHPLTPGYIEKVWVNLVPQLINEPSVMSVNLVNEWSFKSGYEGGLMQSGMVSAFVKTMKKRYKTITALNKTWQSDFKSFDKMDSGFYTSRKNIAAYYDWESFRRNEGLDFIKYLKKTLRDLGVKKPLSIKIQAKRETQPAMLGPIGAEREKLDEILDFSGNDGAIVQQYDLYRSLHPDKPTIDSETHTSIFTTPDVFTSEYWSCYLHGCSARLMWAWSGNYSYGLLNSGAVAHVPDVVEAGGRLALDIRRLSNEILSFQMAIPESPVAVLYSPSCSIIDAAYTERMFKVHRELSLLDMPIRFVSEKQLAEGNLGNIDMILIPGAKYATQATVDKIAAFLKKGGIVYANAESLTRTPHNKKLNNSILKKAGIKYYDWSKDGEERQSDFDTIFDKAELERPVRCKAVADGKQVRLDFRALKVKDEILAYAVNLNDKPVELSVTGTKPKEVVELISGDKVTLPLKLKSKGVVMLKIKQ